MSVAYIDTLVIEFDNCFGSIKMMQPLLGGNNYHPRYTRIKAKRAAKIERYIWRARGECSTSYPMYAYPDTTDTNYWSDDDN